MTKLNQIQSYETWQEAFDRIKRSVDEYHTKFWEELEKMTKIDETKQYKFSEIVRMVEDKELPIGTKVLGGYGKSRTLNVQPTMEKYGLQDETQYQSFNKAVIGSNDINNMWTIKLPKEDKYYLKAPKGFGKRYLNLQFSSGEYFFGSISNTVIFQTQFTQSEIDAMPFDINFFEKIKVED